MGREAILGDDHPDSLRIKGIVGRILHAKTCIDTEYQETEKISAKAITGLINKLSATHPEVHYLKSYLALVLLACGQYEEARIAN